MSKQDPTPARVNLPQVSLLPFQPCRTGCRTLAQPPEHEEGCPTHQPFVLDALRKLEKEWPHTNSTKSVLHAALAPKAEPLMVYVGKECVGWVIAPEPQRIVYAYVNHPARRQGVMTAALLELGFDLAKPIALDLWSRAASRIVERGRWRLFPTVLG